MECSLREKKFCGPLHYCPPVRQNAIKIHASAYSYLVLLIVNQIYSPILFFLSSHGRVWINWVRLLILLVVSSTGKMNIPLSPCVPEKLVSRDGFGRPVPCQPAHSPYSCWSWYLLTGFLPISEAASIYLSYTPYAIGSVPSLPIPMVFAAESPPAQGQYFPR